MTREQRITHLSETLRRAADARLLAASPIWAEAWTELERECLERLLECGPTEDEKRYRLQIAIETVRQTRRAIEVRGGTSEQLEKELAILEGAKPRPIA